MGVLTIQGESLLVPRHRRQLGHVLQQNPPALQVGDAVLAPGLWWTVEVFVEPSRSRFDHSRLGFFQKRDDMLSRN